MAADRRYLSPLLSETLTRRYLQKFRTVLLKLSPALTTRERKVLQLVLEGESSFDIGARLKIKLSTVESDIHSMVGKLGANANRDVIRHAVKRRVSPKRPRTSSKKLIN